MEQHGVYRVRFHGRGGQGMKTASRILGTAFFHEGFEVQDAPLYGAERRGAPISASVRAGRTPVWERGPIQHPDLVVVADDTLVPLPAAGVLAGVSDETALLLASDESAAEWQRRLNHAGLLVTLPRTGTSAESRPGVAAEIGPRCAGAAARLVGVIGRDALAAAVEEELRDQSAAVVIASRARALETYDDLAPYEGRVTAGSDAISAAGPPAWIELPFETARVAAPDIHASTTSVQVRTGLWRTMRPVVDDQRCRRCSWVCSTFCPDGAIAVLDDRSPRIDYDHCKGCLICVAVCPAHAISAIPEAGAVEPPREAPS